MKSHHILLVEDDPDDIELFKEALSETKIPHDVAVITEGDEVVPFLEDGHSRPDVIVLDLNIPKTPGKEILTKLKSDTRFRQIPIVVLTTSSSRTDIEYCLKNGAEKYITKPVDTKGFEMMAATIFSVAGRN